MRPPRKTKLLLPAALIVTAGTSCTPAPPVVCGSEQHHACWPDGGFACPSDCGGLHQADGGLEVDSTGMPICLC